MLHYFLRPASVALLVCLALVQSTAAQTTSGTAADLRLTPRVTADFSTPRNGDNERSFTQLNGFIPLVQTPGGSVTFLNTSARLDTGGHWGGSVAVGHRWQLEDLLLGGYLSYDLRDTGNATFNQIGLGLEVFGDVWDVHLNGYIPVGDSSSLVSGSDGTGQTTNAFFQGSQLFFAAETTQTAETALGGVDLEAGWQLGDFGDTGVLWGYGSLYYLGDSIGGGARVDYRLANHFRTGLGLQSDGIFGTRVFFSIGTGFGGAPRGNGEDNSEGENDSASALWARAAEALTRNSGVAVEEETVVTGTTALTTAVNPATGEPWVFSHVTSGGSGDGSFESPFGAIASATAAVPTDGNGIIYVSGDGTLAGGFTIPGGVQLLSSGPEQFINVNDNGGNPLQLPGSGSNSFPLLADTVTLASSATSSTVVSGFTIQSAAGNGVTADNSSGEIVVSDNRITAQQDGVAVAAPGATAAGAVTIRRNSINATTGDGIDLAFNNTTANAAVTIADNTITANQTGAEVTSEGGSNLTQGVIITGNTITAEVAGVIVGNDGSSQIAGVNISNNPGITVTGSGTIPSIGTGSGGIAIANSDGSTITNGITVSGNGPIQVTPGGANPTLGIVVVNQGATVTGNITIENTESIQVNGGTTNVALLSTGDPAGLGTVAISLVNLTSATQAGTINGSVSVNGNTNMTSNDLGVVLANASSSANATNITGNLTASNNSMTAADDGLLFLNGGLTGTSQISGTVLFSNNTITATADDGIDLTMTTAGTVVQSVQVLNNILNSGGDSIKFTQLGGVTQNIQLNANTLTGGENGIEYNGLTGTVGGNLEFDGNTFTVTPGPDINCISAGTVGGSKPAACP